MIRKQMDSVKIQTLTQFIRSEKDYRPCQSDGDKRTELVRVVEKRGQSLSEWRRKEDRACQSGGDKRIELIRVVEIRGQTLLWVMG